MQRPHSRSARGIVELRCRAATFLVFFSSCAAGSSFSISRRRELRARAPRVLGHRRRDAPPGLWLRVRGRPARRGLGAGLRTPSGSAVGGRSAGGRRQIPRRPPLYTSRIAFVAERRGDRRVVGDVGVAVLGLHLASRRSRRRAGGLPNKWEWGHLDACSGRIRAAGSTFWRSVRHAWAAQAGFDLRWKMLACATL